MVRKIATLNRPVHAKFVTVRIELVIYKVKNFYLTINSIVLT